MNVESRILLTGANIVTADYAQTGAILIENETIAKIWRADGNGLAEYDGEKIPLKQLAERISDADRSIQIVELSGKTIMAGGIDAHVHFREPGSTWKADMSTESKAALLGGVTSFIDMPNTKPAVTSIEALDEKRRLAEGRCYANWGFHIGADNANADELRRLSSSDAKRRFAGIKVFMGSSTGNMLVDDKSALENIFSICDSRILIHSEDEATIKKNLEVAREQYGNAIPMKEHENIRSRQACIRSTIKALELAMRLNTKLHILHVTTAEEVEMIRAAKMYNPEITAETSANYLWFCDEDYDRLGSLVKCNPAIKKATDRAALRRALADGIIDTVGSDHAPHLLKEKEEPYLTCPSGIPSIQQSLAVLLTVANEESIPLTRIASAISEKTAELFGIHKRGKIREGYYADLVVIDTDKEFKVGDGDEGSAGIAYKCGWSPYKGVTLKGMVEEVYLNGRLAVHNGKLVSDSPAGKALEFD